MERVVAEWGSKGLVMMMMMKKMMLMMLTVKKVEAGRTGSVGWLFGSRLCVVLKWTVRVRESQRGGSSNNDSGSNGSGGRGRGRDSGGGSSNEGKEDR